MTAPSYDWPWLYAVQAGRWQLTDTQAKGLREYLLRGGFFMADDFWGEADWDTFMASMQKVFPDRDPWTGNGDPIFHTVTIWTTATRWPAKGPCSVGEAGNASHCPDHWRGIFDDQRPPDGGHHLSVRRGRFLGVGRRASIRRNMRRWESASA